MFLVQWRGSSLYLHLLCSNPRAHVIHRMFRACLCGRMCNNSTIWNSVFTFCLENDPANCFVLLLHLPLFWPASQYSRIVFPVHEIVIILSKVATCLSNLRAQNVFQFIPLSQRDRGIIVLRPFRIKAFMKYNFLLFPVAPDVNGAHQKPSFIVICWGKKIPFIWPVSRVSAFCFIAPLFQPRQNSEKDKLYVL